MLPSNMPSLSDSAYRVNGTTPDAHEQLMIELINRARLNPQAEVKISGDSIAPGASSTPVQALAPVTELDRAAQKHSTDMMVRDYFSHTSLNGKSPFDRMRDEGYVYRWAGENLAWSSLDQYSAVQVVRHHTGLWASDGHQRNLLNPNFNEVGVGYASGASGNYMTQKFGSRTDVYLTGVVIDDNDGDLFYDLGEGQADVRITAYNNSVAVGTSTWNSGGYSLALNPGTYTVVFEGGDLKGHVVKTVSIGTKNIKLDIVEDRDAIVSTAGSTPQQPAQDQPAPQTPAPTPTTNQNFKPSDYDNQIYGNSGDNPLKGTSKNDWIAGGGGRDNIFGGGGNDYIIAGSGQDLYVRGGSGADIFQFGRGDGSLKIFDWQDGVDKIALAGGLAFSDLTKSVSTYNGITTVTFKASTGERLQFRDEKASDINSGDFITTSGGSTGGSSGGSTSNPVDVFFSKTLKPEDFDRQIYGTGGDNRLQGTSQNDWIDGRDGKDKISGGAGNDYIIAGAGNDYFVQGGAGADIFRFRPGDENLKIFDWQDGVDKIDLAGGLSFSDLKESKSTYNGITTTVLKTAAGDRLMFHDTQPNQIDAGDFI